MARFLRRAARAALLLLPFAHPGAALAQSTSIGAAAPLSADSDGAIFPRLDAARAKLEAEGWLIGGQATFILQGNAGFHSPYRAEGSLRPVPLARNTFSADLILGRKLWEGAEVVIDPQVSRGFGISNSTGVAAFPNGEAFRLGTSYLAGYVPRAFFRQTIALSGDTIPAEELDDDPLRFHGSLPRDRLTITAGKVSLYDIFDDNRYAHDPRSQFLNWALVGGGAFDFAADARGFTNGVAVEMENPTWALRTGAFQVAKRLNSLSLDPQPFKGYQLIAEIDHYHQIGELPGAVRLLFGYDRTRSQDWNELVANNIEETAVNPTGAYRSKRMVELNLEQALTRDLGAFVRLSWNDGKSQNWMFTEMDDAISGGLSLKGRRWDRPGDTVGMAANWGGISAGHRRFLEAGGIGFITGDGRLNYGRELALEAYYDASVAPGTNIAVDYQLVVNPAYNQDRGPVSVFALRLRTAF